MQETLPVIENQGKRQLNALVVGCFLDLLIRQLHTQLVDVEADIGLVIYREVQEEILTNGIDVVQLLQTRRAKWVMSAVESETAGL